jgi:hypothetical protein
MIKMENKSKYNIVAEVVRIEHSPTDDKVFLVFEIVDEKFKKKIKQDWTQDIDLKIVGKGLEEVK